MVGSGGMWANTETSRSSAEAGASTTMSIYILCQEYKAAGEPQGGPAPAIMTGRHAGKSLFMFGYNFVSTDIRSEKEAW